MAGRPDDRVDVELVEDDGRNGGDPDAAGGTDRRPAFGRDGTLRAEFEGVLAEPEMSDGSESGVFLVTRSDRETLVGVDVRTGADLWTYPLRGGRTLVRHSGLVVVADRHEVVALELLSACGSPRPRGRGILMTCSSCSVRISSSSRSGRWFAWAEP